MYGLPYCCINYINWIANVTSEHVNTLDRAIKRNGLFHIQLGSYLATHAFDFNPNGPGGQIAEWAILRFLHDVTH